MPEPRPAAPDTGLEASFVRLLGGRLLAALPPGESHDHGPVLPGKILGCTEYETSTKNGGVTITALELGALASDDLEADARAELKAWHRRTKVSEVAWSLAAFARSKTPLRAVAATPDAAVGYLCGPPAADAPLVVKKRFFVTMPDDSVVALDFSFDEASEQPAESVVTFADDVVASLAPGPVALVRTAGTRVLPDIPPGQDLEFEAPEETVVAAAYLVDSTLIEVARLRPMGQDAAPDVVAWSHPCDPDDLEAERRRRRRGTFSGLATLWLSGRERGRLFEDILIEDESTGECTYLNLWADDAEGLAALRSTLEASRRVKACADADDCDGLPCSNRRCVPENAPL